MSACRIRKGVLYFGLGEAVHIPQVTTMAQLRRGYVMLLSTRQKSIHLAGESQVGYVIGPLPEAYAFFYPPSRNVRQCSEVSRKAPGSRKPLDL